MVRSVPFRIHGASLVVLQGDGQRSDDHLADEIFQRGLTVQRVVDVSLNGQGAVGVTFIIHIGIIGVPRSFSPNPV